jgi:hypothetical protein
LTRDDTGIEELVRIAAQEKSSAARRRLFGALIRVELFFPVKIKHHEGKPMRATPLLRLGDGTHAMMLYTSKAHPDLPDSFGGGFFKDALAAAIKMPELDWVIVSNRASQWVAVGTEEISAILGDLHPDEDEGNDVGMTSNGGFTDEMLEGLITRAVHSTPEEVSPPIDSVLAGREIYLELTDGQNHNGRHSMNIFQVGDMRNVVRAYLTRKRPGIKYGGIRWEALKEMMRNEPGLDGVQIINEADDWVVFNRESLGFTPKDQSQ